MEKVQLKWANWDLSGYFFVLLGYTDAVFQ